MSCLSNTWAHQSEPTTPLSSSWAVDAPPTLYLSYSCAPNRPKELRAPSLKHSPLSPKSGLRRWI